MTAMRRLRRTLGRTAMSVASAAVRRSPVRVLRMLPLSRPGRLILGYSDTPLTLLPHYYTDLPTQHGFVMSGSTEDLIQRRIFQFGTWEPELTALMESRVSPGDVVLDVGANIGFFTLLAASQVGPSGRVLSFEPMPSLTSTLDHHVSVNNFECVEVHPVALGHTAGFISVYSAPARNTGRSSVHAQDDFVYEGDVPCLVGAEVIPTHLWPRIRFVKIDVEGAEESVVQGMLPVLAALGTGATVVVEISPCGAKMPMSDHPVVREMSAVGYIGLQLRNDYTHAGYVSSSVTGPVPLPTYLDQQIDVVFTKA